MRTIIRRLLLAIIGGGLLILTILSFYNILNNVSILNSIPPILFFIGSIFSLWKSFENV